MSRIHHRFPLTSPNGLCLLISGRTGTLCAAGANPSRRSATHKQRILKFTVTSQVFMGKEARHLEEETERRGFSLLVHCLSDTAQSELSTTIWRNENQQ